MARVDRRGNEARQPLRRGKRVGVDKGDELILRRQSVESGELVPDLLSGVGGKAGDSHFDRRSRLRSRRNEDAISGVLLAFHRADDPERRIGLRAKQRQEPGKLWVPLDRQDHSDPRLRPWDFGARKPVRVSDGRKGRKDVLGAPKDPARRSKRRLVQRQSFGTADHKRPFRPRRLSSWREIFATTPAKSRPSLPGAKSALPKRCPPFYCWRAPDPDRADNPWP